MKALGLALAAIFLAGQATAQPRYDRKLEAAAMAIVASRIGDLRGGFAFGARPVMVVVRDDDTVMGTTVTNAARLAPESMARADDRLASPTAF